MSKVIRITLDGKSFTTDDLTLGEAEQVEKATGESWLTMNPLRSALHCKAIIVAYLSRDHTPEEADAIATALTVKQATEAVEVVEDDLPDEYEDGIPKEEEGLTTQSS